MQPKPQERDAFELFQAHFDSRRAGTRGRRFQPFAAQGMPPQALP
ncbi:MAG: hypothetical protein AAB385_07075 [Planctomycetota bacterium]